MNLIDPASLATFVAAALVIVIAPGPDFAMVVARSVSGGWRVGVATSLGFSPGCWHTPCSRPSVSAPCC